jgi:putative membrane protein
MDESNDPRVYFAAERTMLAWLRTGITVMGLGFLVARFGMFLRLVRGEMGSHPVASSVIGIAFVVLGTIMVILAAIQHRQFVREFRGSFPPTRQWPALGLWVSALIAISGAALALYLAASVVGQ